MKLLLCLLAAPMLFSLHARSKDSMPTKTKPASLKKNAKAMKITLQNLGPIQLGTPLKKAYQELSKQGSIYLIALVEHEAYPGLCLGKGGSKVICLTSDKIDRSYAASKIKGNHYKLKMSEIPDNAKLNGFVVRASEVITDKGVHPGMPIREIEKRYGASELHVNPDTIYVVFENSPRNNKCQMSFFAKGPSSRYLGEDSAKAEYAIIDGVKSKVPIHFPSSGTYKDFNRDLGIESIVVDCSDK